MIRFSRYQPERQLLVGFAPTRVKRLSTAHAILIMKLWLKNAPIDVGMKFGLRSGAQVRTSGKVRVTDAAGW